MERVIDLEYGPFCSGGPDADIRCRVKEVLLPETPV